jgi:hypothetical protein
MNVTMTRRDVSVAIVTLVLLLPLLLQGVLSLAHAAALVLLLGAVWLVVRNLLTGSELRPAARSGLEDDWPKPVKFAPLGRRMDVSELSWAALTRTGHVSPRLLRRLRHITAQRLASHGVVYSGKTPPPQAAQPGGLPTAPSASPSPASPSPSSPLHLLGWGTNAQDAAAHQSRAVALLGQQVVEGLTQRQYATPRQVNLWLNAIDGLIEPEITAAKEGNQ